MNKKILILIVFASLIAKITFTQNLHQLLSNSIDLVVAADGSGDYSTLMEAILASQGNQVIFIKNGVYHEKVEIQGGKNNLTIIGENVDSTIIQYNDYSGSGKDYDGIIPGFMGQQIGTTNSHSFYNGAYDLTLMNLTIKNTAGDVGQAVALNLDKDRTTIVRCRIICNQDTFLTRSAARHLLKDCFIEGDVDFIFGGGAVIFDSCVVNSDRGNSHITAPATDKSWNFGYVFQNCSITANDGVNNVYFARPWHNYPKVNFMNCYLGSHIATAGWVNPWGLDQDNCTFTEYNNYGSGAETAYRVNWSYQLTDAFAKIYTREMIFSTEVSKEITSNWNPDIENNALYKIIRENTELLYNEKFNSAFLTDIKIEGNSISDFNSSKIYFTVNIPSGSIPQIEAVTESAKASTVIEYPDEVAGTAKIIVTAGNGFKKTYYLNISISSNINQHATEHVKVQSNIVRNSVVLITTNLNYDVDFTLFDIAGKTVIEKSFSRNKMPNELSVNTGHIEKGNYIYLIKYNNRSLSGKLIKIN
jgi:pectinesterase